MIWHIGYRFSASLSHVNLSFNNYNYNNLGSSPHDQPEVVAKVNKNINKKDKVVYSVPAAGILSPQLACRQPLSLPQRHRTLYKTYYYCDNKVRNVC